MSDFLRHECGIALVRLRKPVDFYIEKYGFKIQQQSVFNKAIIKQSKTLYKTTTKIKKLQGRTFICEFYESLSSISR